MAAMDLSFFSAMNDTAPAVSKKGMRSASGSSSERMKRLRPEKSYVKEQGRRVLATALSFHMMHERHHCLFNMMASYGARTVSLASEVLSVLQSTISP